MRQTNKLNYPAYEPEEASAQLEEDELLEENLAHNSTGRGFDIAALLLCVVGITISAYLSYTHFANAQIACVNGNSCEVVNNSKYASFLGQPVALLGLLFYSALMAGTVLRFWLSARMNPGAALAWRGRLDLALFIFSLGGVAFTAYLKAMEIFVIGAICSWCVGSAITITALFILFTVRLLRA